MSRQQHELAVTAEQGVLERHFDTITLRSQAATISLDAATWPECMLIVRDPFANKRTVEHSGGGDHISGRLSEAACAACDWVAINDVISFLHFG